ncbi:MAG: [Burkholderiaceae bacterium]|nr:[NiFe]-hydrogenase assembly chaperone HybE [Burkholderiaceae bacterium]
MNPKTENIPWEENPSKKLEIRFRRIQETMSSLPICHPKVQVQAVDFSPWKYFWLGIMVTPWSINLILSPGDRSRWKSVPKGKKLHYRFPAGIFDFISVHDQDLGEYQMCSMLSPLSEITDHEMAILVARSILSELTKPETEEEAGTPFNSIPINEEKISERIEKNLKQKINRRNFFVKPIRSIENKVQESKR